jgi:hypothetical protein
VAPTKLERTLTELDLLKNQFDTNQTRKLATLLKRLRQLKISDTQSLLRAHEILLFIRAHPANTHVLRSAESQLRSFVKRVVDLEDQGFDLSELVDPEISGIVGSSVIDTFSYRIARWLVERNPGQVRFYWPWFEDENRLADAWPRFMPLLEEDTLVEANIPFRQWLQNARGKVSEVTWLLDQYNKLRVSDTQKSLVYNSQKLYLSWKFGYRDSRTGLRSTNRNPFYHNGPMIQRRDIDLRTELQSPSPKLEHLNLSEGASAIDMALTASTVRYRELYGFSNGDPRSVYKANLGRGVELVLICLPPASRLPLRAYHGAMLYKNGVPIGYFEGLSLFERMESGFNLYYTFRDGETAWLYARVLNVMHHLTGVTAFSLDPYQVGFQNEEGIKSGAFWFYRKLGFRSTSKQIQKLTESEEAKISSRKNYRTPAAKLRRLAEAPMIFEASATTAGAWDKFQIRNVGFSAQRIMMKRFRGEVKRMREEAMANVNELCGTKNASYSEGLAICLLMIPSVKSWATDERKLLARILAEKQSGTETNYLRLMQKHSRLRTGLIKLGSP